MSNGTLAEEHSSPGTHPDFRCYQQNLAIRRAEAPSQPKFGMYAIRSFCAALALLIGTALAWGQAVGSLPPDPTGEWLTAKGYAVIRIVNCDDRLWGVVVWEARPGGIDRKNPDRSLQNRPTLGMPILLGMEHKKANRWDGQIYNSQDGHTYSASISLLNPDKLRVEGCFLAILCGGEDWTREQPQQPGRGSPQPPNANSGNPYPPSQPGAVNGYPAELDADVCLRLLGPPRLPH